jgi:LysR family transcriptional regulator, glycine cleavage system transcriptional activator
MRTGGSPSWSRAAIERRPELPGRSRYLGDISLLLDQLAEATSHFRDSDAVGPLFVTATPAFAARWLVPRIAAFHAGHPQIELHIATSLRPPDFARDRIDVAIRYGQEKLPGLLVVPFFSTTMLPVACAFYLFRLPRQR